MTLLIENFRLFCCIANSLEDGCLPRIGAANDKDTKTTGPVSEILCSFPLSFNILHWLDFSTGKRHFSTGHLRWWKWWRSKISALRAQAELFGYTSAKRVMSLTSCHLNGVRYKNQTKNTYANTTHKLQLDIYAMAKSTLFLSWYGWFNSRKFV